MKRCWIFILSFLMFSCQNIEENKKPKHLIPQDTMVMVLTNLAILNSAKNYNRKLLEETGVQPEEYIYTKYKIDSAQFRLSTEYYAKNYNDYQQIYEKVKTNLEDLKDKYQKLEDEENENNKIIEKHRQILQDTLGYNKVRLET